MFVHESKAVIVRQLDFSDKELNNKYDRNCLRQLNSVKGQCHATDSSETPGGGNCLYCQ